MNGKKARAIRKLLNLNKSSPDMTPTMPITVGSKWVGIIDGVHGNHRAEERSFTQLYSDEEIRLNRMLKKEYVKQTDIGKTLAKDIS